MKGVMLKKLGITFICVVMVVATSFAIATPVHALTPPLLQFGGLATAEIYCTCSGNFWIWFTPLYFNRVPLAGPIVYEPGTIAFRYYFPHPGSWVLGSYMPGVQACWMYAVYGCFPLPSYGIIGPVTGTSP
jgi:hypothetical protein